MPKVYYGITEAESKQKYIEYKHNDKYTGKGLNLDLEGLKKFIVDSKLEKLIKYYFITDLSNFEVLENIYKDEKYNMVVVKVPFKIEITKIFKLFD